MGLSVYGNEKQAINVTVTPLMGVEEKFAISLMSVDSVTDGSAAITNKGMIR